MVDRNKPADCLREPLASTLPTRCQQLKKGYGECKYVVTLAWWRKPGADAQKEGDGGHEKEV